MLCSGLGDGRAIFVKTDKDTYMREIATIVQGRFFATRTEGEPPDSALIHAALYRR